MTSIQRQPLLRNLDELYAASPEAARTRPWWGNRIARRTIYGLPHIYRFGSSYERLRLMSLFLGLQFFLIFTGGIIGLLFLTWSADTNPTLPTPRNAWLYPVFGAVGMLVLLGPPSKWRKDKFEPPLLRPASYHVIVNSATLVTGLFCYSLGTFGLAASPFFLPCAAYSFTFFPNWRAFIYTVFASVCFVVALSAANVQGAAAALTFQASVSVVIGASLGVVVSREWSFRQSNLLSLATISHKLRTPLAGIIARGREDLINPKLQDVPTLLEEIGKITARAESLIDLLVHLLEITRSEAGVGPVDLSDFDLRDTVTTLKVEFTPRAQARGLRLILECSAAPCPIHADKDKIAEAVSNLLDNALKFSPEGGSVHLELFSRDRSFCVRVADDGPGVAHGDRARIFQPFEQGTRRPPGVPSGAGLGLPLAHIYATQHGGDLILEEQEDGAGASFLLRLPDTRVVEPRQRKRLRWLTLHRTPSDTDPGPNEVPQATSVDDSPDQSARVRDLSVLIVDDIREDLEIAERVLGRQGFHVQTADSGGQALECLISTGRFVDLVLLDIDLPDISGSKLLEQIRALPGWQVSTPVVAYTAYTEPEAAQRFQGEGFDGYLPKPLPTAGVPVQLLRLIAQWDHE